MLRIADLQLQFRKKEGVPLATAGLRGGKVVKFYSERVAQRFCWQKPKS
jgi:hypothetical protein